MASDDESSIGRVSSSRSLVVIPSSQLDSNLHEKAAQITKKRHQESEASFEDGSHDDDPMTPPDILLKRALRQAKQLTAEVGVVRKQGEEVGRVLDLCIRCIALSRIVHGDSHWLLARAHIQLAKAYLDLQGLLQQAFNHASKGRDILLAPGSLLKSPDPPFEVTCQLALACCILGQVHTSQGELSKGERELRKARRLLFKAKERAQDEETEVEQDILAALARLHLKQEKHETSRDEFSQSVDLTRSRFGARSARLLSLLRGKATAEAHLSLYEAADQTLREALEIAEAECGAESESTGEVLQAQARLGAARLKAGGGQVELKSVEDKFAGAFSTLSSVLGEHSEKALQAKEEWCVMLASLPEGKEKAIPLLKELVGAKRQAHGELSAEVGHVLKLLGSVLLALGRTEGARDYLQQAEMAYKCSLGTAHPDTVALSRALQTVAGSEGSGQQRNQTKPLFRTVV